jgi:hypothetical protein
MICYPDLSETETDLLHPLSCYDLMLHLSSSKKLCVQLAIANWPNSSDTVLLQLADSDADHRSSVYYASVRLGSSAVLYATLSRLLDKRCIS